MRLGSRVEVVRGRRLGALGRRALPCLAILLAVLSVRGAERELVAEAPRGELALVGESRLRIDDARGVVRVRGGDEGVIRFLSTTVGDSSHEIPVTLTSDGTTLFVGGEGESVERDLWVAVPAGFTVAIEIDAGKVALSDVAAGISVRGKDVDLVVRRMEGDLEVAIEGGAVRGSAVIGDVDVSGGSLVVDLSEVDGGVDLTAQDSQVRVVTVGGGADLRVVNTPVVLGPITGSLTLDARGGTAEIQGLRGGGEFHLEGTPLTVTDSEGVVTADTDAEVRLENIAGEGGAVHVRGMGSRVRGFGIKTSLDVVTDNAGVVLENVDGRVGIQGSGLDVRLKSMHGELALALSGSGVDIENASAAVSVHNEMGDVLIRDTRDTVVVRNRLGNVSVRQAQGAVEIEVQDGDVDVEWTAVPRSRNSLVRTENGDVDLTIAGTAGWRIDARTRRGRIASDHPDVRVSDDGEFASSVARGARGVTLKVDCDGDLSIHSGGTAPSR